VLLKKKLKDDFKKKYFIIKFKQIERFIRFQNYSKFNPFARSLGSNGGSK
jgi:hypothetical protein